MRNLPGDFECSEEKLFILLYFRCSVVQPLTLELQYSGHTDEGQQLAGYHNFSWLWHVGSQLSLEIPVGIYRHISTYI